MKSEDEYYLSIDQPCVNITQDRFEREPFGKAITNCLTLPLRAFSQVVALTADWGFGKTSVINFIEDELENHNASL